MLISTNDEHQFAMFLLEEIRWQIEFYEKRGVKIEKITITPEEHKWLLRLGCYRGIITSISTAPLFIYGVPVEVEQDAYDY